MNQCEMVLKFLEKNGSITTFESYEQLGITRLPSRTHDLKRMGYEFEEEWVTKVNRYGRHVSFKKYTLKKNC